MADELKAEHWRGVVAEQEASGMSVAAFCRERTIPAWKFHYWRKRLRGEASVPGEFLVVDVAQALYPSSERHSVTHCAGWHWRWQADLHLLTEVLRWRTS